MEARKAVENFSSISEYKGSAEKVVSCEQRGSELKEKAEAVIRAFEKHFKQSGVDQSKADSPQEQLKKQETKLSELKKLLIILPDLLQQKETNKKELTVVDSKISGLQNKRRSLGIFARKQKAAIDIDLERVNKERKKLIIEDAGLTEKMNGYTSTAALKDQIDSCMNQIEALKLEIQKSERSSEMSFDEAKQCVKNADIRTAVKNKKPEYRNLIYFADPGAQVRFGNYHGSIEWKVLERNGNRLLLISKYALDAVCYNKEPAKITWETCTLRQWLNKGFLQEAFNPEEQRLIASIRVTADKNPQYDTDPGNATTDKVFLLSILEAKKYFNSDKERRCAPTEYAKTRGATINENCCKVWWLRSPGDRSPFYDSNHVADVNYDGSINMYGDDVDIQAGCVRPALWLDLDNL